MSTHTEENVALKEDVGSSEVESAVPIAAAGGREFSPNPLDISDEMLERSEEEARLVNPESFRSKTVSVAGALIVRSFVLCGDMNRVVYDLPMRKKSVTFGVAETGKFVNIVGSSNPMLYGVLYEGLTFK